MIELLSCLPFLNICTMWSARLLCKYLIRYFWLIFGSVKETSLSYESVFVFFFFFFLSVFDNETSKHARTACLPISAKMKTHMWWPACGRYACGRPALCDDQTIESTGTCVPKRKNNWELDVRFFKDMKRSFDQKLLRSFSDLFRVGSLYMLLSISL